MANEPDDVLAANDVRLSPREWLVALAISAVALLAIPLVWRRLEPLEAGADCRLPYSLSSDYWFYDRACRAAAAGRRTLVVGDSVIWGHYVPTDQTLTHHLNAGAGGEQFANLGVDGIHPAAMAGLIELYGRGIAGCRVVLHANLLWTASPRHDLQTRKEASFNHPTLVPQLSAAIPCYRETPWNRVRIAARHRVPLCGWAEHVQQAYFGRPSRLVADDVLDWRALAARLDPQQRHPLAARLAALLPDDARDAARASAAGDGEPETPEARRLLEALNALIDRRDLLRPEDLAGLALPLEARELLSRDRASLSAMQVRRANRLALQAAFPTEIAEARFQPERVAKWHVEHPYENPAAAFAWGLPSPDEAPTPTPDARPWTRRDIAKFNPPWVDLATSIQWAFFRRTIATLRRRGNTVFVVLGPFNEHMLAETSRAAYLQRKAAAEAWLRGQGIPHCIAPLLPSELYADASHPLGQGYALLAERLLGDQAFRRFCGLPPQPERSTSQ